VSSNRSIYYFIYQIIAPAILGLMALALIVLPGDRKTGNVLAGLAVYLLITVVSSVIMARRFDRDED
jgi:lipopolysaccharide export LptBFGC system permease protein LptF